MQLDSQFPLIRIPSPRWLHEYWISYNFRKPFYLTATSRNALALRKYLPTSREYC